MANVDIHGKSAAQADVGAKETLPPEDLPQRRLESSDPPRQWTDGTDIEGYAKIELIGEGGMGVVWKARQLSTKRLIALKLISGVSVGSEHVRRRFDREVELAAKLEHPFIARIYDSGLDRGVGYCAMELVEGLSLTSYADARGLSPQACVELMLKVCRGVAYAHEHAVIHRDLKPSNILITDDGTPKLLDFGVAKALGEGAAMSGLTVSGEIIGTPAYMSPEQARGDVASTNTRGDVWSLGAILFELVTGSLPFETGDGFYNVLKRVAEEMPRRPRAVRPGLDRELEAILLKCLSRDSAQRYANAGELADELQRYLQGAALAARPATTGYLLRKHIARHKVEFGVAATFAAVATAAVVFYVISMRTEQGHTRAAQRVAELKAHESTALAAEAADQRNIALNTLEDLIKGGSFAWNRADPNQRRLLEAARSSLGKMAEATPKGRARAKQRAYLMTVSGQIEAQLGLLSKAAASYRQAISQYHEGSEFPSVADWPADDRFKLTEMHVDLASVLLEQGESGEALRELEVADGLLDSLLANDAEQPELLRERLWAHLLQGDALLDMGRGEEALQLYEGALNLANSPPFGADTRAKVQRRVAAVWQTFAKKSTADSTTRDRAIHEAAIAVELDRGRLAADPLSPASQRDLALSLLRLSRIKLAAHDTTGTRDAAGQAHSILSRHEFVAKGDLETVLDAAEALTLLLGTYDVAPDELLKTGTQHLEWLARQPPAEGKPAAQRTARVQAMLRDALGVAAKNPQQGSRSPE